MLHSLRWPQLYLNAITMYILPNLWNLLQYKHYALYGVVNCVNGLSTYGLGLCMCASQHYRVTIAASWINLQALKSPFSSCRAQMVFVHLWNVARLIEKIIFNCNTVPSRCGYHRKKCQSSLCKRDPAWRVVWKNNMQKMGKIMNDRINAGQK